MSQEPHHHRISPDVELDDLFTEKLEPLEDACPDCDVGGTITGLSVQDPNLSPTTKHRLY